MRIGIVVDSCCDLPQDYIEKHNIVILPITVRIGEAVLADHRNEQATLEFLHAHVAERGHEAESIPFGVEQIRDLFLSKLVIDYDQVFCMTILKSRSPIFDHATQASFAILNDYKPIRTAAGHASPFSLRVMDTQTMFSGQAITAIEAVRMRDKGANMAQMRMRLEQLANNSYMYGLPRDLYYLRTRARSKGDRSVGWMSATLGSALDIKPVLRAWHGVTEPTAKVKGFEAGAEKLFEFTAQKVRQGQLLTPTVALSYGGELDELRGLPGYGPLLETCAAHDVEVFESVQSLTAMVNVGKGGLCVGFAAEPHELKL